MIGNLAVATHRRHPAAAAVIFVLCGAAQGGCKKQDNLRGDERVKVLVDRDRKLAKQEENLLNRRGTLQRERSQVRDKRAALINRKMALAAEDTDGKKALEKEESQLVKLESQLAQQEVALNKQLQQLVVKKTNLVGEASGSTKEIMLRRREYNLVSREKDIARREADVARREKQFAAREQALAVRQARLCSGGTTTVIQRVVEPKPRGRAYTRKDVEPVYRAALKAMRVKGLLVADLPGGVDRLVTEVRHAVSKKEYARAKFAADQLLASVRKIRVDRAFIGAKISRLSAALRRRPARGAAKSKVAALFQQATAAYGDGRFSAANSKLNKIYGLMR